jgi:curved DNA-binding protein CbpA
LSEAKLVGTLLELHHTRCSCVVRFERGNVRKQLVLSQGNLAFAESNVPAEHLANILTGLNLIEQKDLQQVSSLMKDGKTSDEAVKLATGLDILRLLEGVREQAVVILASLFTWSESRPRFFEGEGLARRRYLLDLSIPQALVDAARRASGDQAATEFHSGGPAILSADPDPGMRASLPLNSAEAYAYAQVHGPTPLSDLLSLLPPGASKPEELVRRLLLLGLLRLQAKVPEQAAAAGVQEALFSAQIDDLLQHFEVANYYEILSVPTDAREEDIKAAYHEMARHYHPDRFEAKGRDPALRARVERLFTYITAAYTTLGEQSSRAGYDESRLKQESQVEATLQARTAADTDKEKMAAILFHAGLASLKNREFEKAVQQLRECVWLRPDIARFHHFLGVAQAEIASLRKEAEKHFLKAIELDHMNPDSYTQLGKLYLKVNLPNRAEVQFLEALHWDSENAEALKMLASLGK